MLIRMSQFFSSLLLTVLFSYPLFAQIAIGQWRDHLPYTQGVQVADAGDWVFAASDFGLFQYHKTEGDVIRLSKVSGLSDIGFSGIAWSDEHNTLVVAYNNTNIDLIQDGQIINVPDIKDKSILGNKTIHKIHIRGDFAYLACGFAIVVLDIVKHEIKDTYYIGDQGSAINIYDIATTNDKIYACTEEGVLRANVDDINLANFENWSSISSGIPTGNYNTCTWFADKLFVNLSVDGEQDTVYRWAGNAWSRFDAITEPEINYLESTDEKMLVSAATVTLEFNTNQVRERVVFQYGAGFWARPSHAIVDDESVLWIADKQHGLVRHGPAPGFTNDIINVNGPSSISSMKIHVEDGKCYIASGSINGDVNTYSKNGLYAFKDNEWENIGVRKFPETTNLHDYVSVIVDPFDSKRVFTTSYGLGVVEYYDDEFVAFYDTLNSTLEYSGGGAGTRVQGLQIDRRDGTLWVTGAEMDHTIHAKDAAGNWYAFDSPAIARQRLSDLAIDDSGQKWIVIPRTGVLVYNDGGTLGNTNDDQSIRLTQNAGNGNLASNDAICIVNDLDGEIWVGTDNGISVFYSPETVFDGGDFDSQRILIEQDGYVQYLLENESVTAIAVDGANRKWIGTSNAGVFLLSEDGTEEVHHFTTENSPLYSDQITSLGVDHLSGEVFIGTDKGIISYKGTATGGVPEFEKEDVYAYPNPVEPGYDGPIAIKGLVRDADVKISDAAGNVVYATTAEGGQAIWDGNKLTGGRAQSGVYLVFASNEDGKETFVTKILFIN